MSRQTISSKRRSAGRDGVRMPFRRLAEKAISNEAARLFTTRATSARMARVGQAGTAPELAVRRACSAVGMRYRTRNRDLPGRPDLANRSRKWAIFVHGCFWHRHPQCARATLPRTNAAYWRAKFVRNVERDAAAQAHLRSLGFALVTIWECETANLETLRATISALARRCNYEVSKIGVAAARGRSKGGAFGLSRRIRPRR